MYNIDLMHKKISKLKLKFLDDDNDLEETNPSNKDKGKKKSLESNEPVQVQHHHKLRKEKKPNLKKILLTTVCVIVPFLFPVFVYHIESFRSFFWPATGFSTIASVLLLLYLTSRIPVVMSGFNKARGKVKIVVQDTEYFSNKRRVQCTVLVAVVLVVFGVAHWAGTTNNRVLFNWCLVAIGYIAGVFSTILYGFFKESKRLPFHSPLHKKREGPSPAKRELDFSSTGLASSPCLSPMDCFRPSPEKDRTCSELIHRGPLPVPPLPPPLKHSPSKQKRSYSPFD